MVDITNKLNTYRIAKAQAILKVSSKDTIDAILAKSVPKGDVFATSKAVGLLGVKRTADLLPDCHPIPLEYADVSYEIHELQILIQVTVKTIYKTGVEVEAMHGASLVALNIYDMLKPIDKSIEIQSIKLLSKHGGKSDIKTPNTNEISAGIIVCSDTLSAWQGKDKSGKMVKQTLSAYKIATSKINIVPDEIDSIRGKIKTLLVAHNLIIISGGTGLSPRDVTPEAVIPLLEKRIPGAEELIRREGQNYTPFAMLSRSVVGTIDNNIVVAIPGSPKGVAQSLDAVLPHLLHTYSMMKGKKH